MITFYSDPRDAFLTSVFRLLEVFDCGYVAVFVSSPRGAEAGDAVNRLRSFFRGVDFEVFSLFPSPSDLKGFEDLQERVLRSLKSFYNRWIVVAAFSGSRLEVATTVLEVSRVREKVILVYIPFFFGPWSGLFYPFTPRPLEPIAVLHPGPQDVERANVLAQAMPVLHSLSNRDVDELLEWFGVGSRLRRRVAYTQHRMNLEYANTYAIYPTSFSCKPMRILVTVGNATVANVEIMDYCSYEEVVEAVDNLGREVVEKANRLRDDAGRSIELLSRFSAILLPTVSECTFDCSDYKGHLLIDALPWFGEEALVDTNILYLSLHTLLYEEKPNVKIPLCAYIEMLRHKAHYENPYERLRSSIASLAIEELKTMKLQIDERANTQPCEVGIALANKLAVTSDRKAFKEIFEEMKINAILVEPKPLKEVGFARRGDTRRIAYAYYAIAQLKTIASISGVAEALNSLGIKIEIK